MQDKNAGAAGVSATQQQAAGTQTEALTTDIQSVDRCIGYIEDFNRAGTAPPGGWQAAVVEPLQALKQHLQEPQQFYVGGTPNSGR